MNSLLNTNIELFNSRFPQLAQIHKVQPCEGILIETAKNGQLTAKENSLYFHSKYSPSSESEKLISAFDESKMEAAVFFSFGLGYGPDAFARKFKNSTLILIEQNPQYFFTALKSFNWENIFRHEKLILLLGASEKEASSFLRNFKTTRLCIFKNQNQCFHSKNYFEAIQTELEKSRQKEQINTGTLEKFSSLWLKNSCRNLPLTAKCDGVNKYSNLGKEMPFVILAAGPSLEKVLPYLNEIKKRAVLISVDTSLKACLEHNVEPDFVVLIDPQYAAALHLEFLEAKNSVLITESAVYPCVFRFPCKEKVLCSSLFPMGQYFEKLTGEKGKLASGGSVATSCWDFARLCGAREIYIAGMDLGFPQKQTHIKGSQFEEKAHLYSKKFLTAETNLTSYLMSAPLFQSKDYNGKSILSDSRMSLFAWWFENAVEKAEKNGTKTFTLTPESTAIKGIEISSVEKLLKKNIITQKKEEFFAQASRKARELKQNPSLISFEKAYSLFLDSLNLLEEKAKKALSLCKSAQQNPLKRQEIFFALTQLDKEILASQAKDAASLVFPTERQLEKLTENLPQNPQLKQIELSKIIYTQLLNAVRQYKKNLPNA